MTRKPIMLALFALLPAAGYVTRSRVLEHILKVPPERMPAQYLTHAGIEQPTPLGHGVKNKWQFNPKVYLYFARTADDVPSDLLADALDAVEAAFTPPPAVDAITLGGLVKHARIQSIETDEGTLGDKAMAIVTLDVLATP